MYQQLSVEDSDGPDYEKSAAAPPRRSRTILALLVVIFLETTLLLASYRGAPSSCACKPAAPPKLYTPVHGVLEDIIKVFHYEPTFVREPSPALDAAWDDLQKYSKVRLPRSEAALLPNQTSGIPDDPGYYAADLEVYHQLHCLNQIRQALHPTYYPNWGMHSVSSRQFHIDHCVERIRQGLMCSADTSVLVYQWNSTFDETRVRLSVPHQCKNWTKIHEWNRENALRTEFNRSIHLPDDLPVPPLIY
ncbi:hypothetical protein C8R45DRAFT_907025 [Mycena sanguinolenta]|nr:hypothetical protein C8R45DRAFT_907025 [Mycena sanguinolenta]